jgi:salicylate hydroxylase
VIGFSKILRIISCSQGQGGTQSIEDAEGFSLFNRPDISRETVPNILKDFERVRRSRASKIQDITREAHERKSPEQMFKHNLYNWTYPGIHKCLQNLNDGKEMIAI